VLHQFQYASQYEDGGGGGANPPNCGGGGIPPQPKIKLRLVNMRLG